MGTGASENKSEEKSELEETITAIEVLGKVNALDNQQALYAIKILRDYPRIVREKNEYILNLQKTIIHLQLLLKEDFKNIKRCFETELE